MGVIAVAELHRDPRASDPGHPRTLLLVASGHLGLRGSPRGLRQAVVVALDLVLDRLELTAQVDVVSLECAGAVDQLLVARHPVGPRDQRCLELRRDSRRQYQGDEYDREPACPTTLPPPCPWGGAGLVF